MQQFEAFFLIAQILAAKSIHFRHTRQGLQTTKAGHIVCLHWITALGRILLVLINPFVKIGANRKNSCHFLCEPWPVILLDLGFSQNGKRVAISVLVLGFFGIDFSVEFDFQIVLLALSTCAMEMEASGSQVKFWVVNVFCSNSDKKNVFFRDFGIGSLSPKNYIINVLV